MARCASSKKSASKYSERNCALGLYEQDGARVDWDLQRVYLDREQADGTPGHRANITSRMHSRNPERNRLVGKNAVNFTTVASAPNSSDMEGGRRTGNFEDYCNFMRLAQSFDVIDFLSGYPVEPIDITSGDPPPGRHAGGADPDRSGLFALLPRWRARQ